MTLKNRIEKLEKSSAKEADSCTCPATNGPCGVWMPDLDMTEADCQKRREDFLKPEQCTLCGKKISKQLIEVVWVDGEAKRIDHFA